MGMKHKKLFIAIIVLVCLAAVSIVHISVSFNREGLNTGLRGMVPEDEYPNWVSSENVSQLECDVLEKRNLLFSNVYLIERAGHYQVRFRIAYAFPFTRRNLFGDMDWIMEDSHGNHYMDKGRITVYGEQIAGLHCVNVTWVLDEETYGALSGDIITLSAVCSDYGSEEVYARCTTEISFAE